ncbi:MAG: hypothetical protein ACUVSX_15080 [Aggregatilineales bacterium]
MFHKIVNQMSRNLDGMDFRSREGLDAVWTLIILGVIAVLAALVFAIVPSLQNAGNRMKSTLDGAPW